MKRIIIFLMMFIALSGVTLGTDGLASCTLTGNHYECTGTISAKDKFDAGTYSIHISNATISYTGATGAAATAGENALLSITTTGRILIESSSISVAGGTGGNGNSAGVGSGGAGGTGTIYINSTKIEIYNTNFSSTGGTGGLGDSAKCGGCTCAEEGNGGDGGNGYISIGDSTSNITSINNSLLIVAGTGSKGSADSCVTTTGTSNRINCADADGGLGANAYLYFYYNNLILNNTLLNEDSGSGGEPDVSPCDEYMGGSTSTVSNSGEGTPGNIGYSNTYFYGTNLFIKNFNVDYDYGTGFNGAAIGGIICESSDRAIQIVVGGSTPVASHTFYVNSTYMYVDNITGRFDGANTNYYPDQWGGHCTSAEDEDHNAAVNGQGLNMYLIASNSSSVVKNSQITEVAGIGNEVMFAYETDYTTPTGISGNGGTNYYYLYNVNFTNSNITSTGGVSGADGGEFVGTGAGGKNILYTYGNTTIDTGSIISFIGGASASASSCSPGNECGTGRGGDSYLYNYGILNLKGKLIFTGGLKASNDGGYCVDGCFGGYASLLNNNTLYLTTANLTLVAGGVAGGTGEGGDVEIVSGQTWNGTNYNVDSIATLVSRSTNITGTAGSAAGDCVGLFTGKVQFFNTSYLCTAATGDGNWTGNNMTQFDYRAGNIINLVPLNMKNISLYYFGSSQKFLIQNSTFNKTSVFWDNSTCKFANLTPASIGTVILNSTCASSSFDAYYTDINKVSQVWKYNGAVKSLPYSYPNYTCTINVDIPDDTSNTLYANISWYKNGVLNTTQSNYTLVDSVDYNSTAIIQGGLTIGDNITCNLSVHNLSTIITTKGNLSTVVPAYPYNLKIDVGNDGTYEYNGTGIFNSTVASTYLKNGINAYLRDCDTTNCSVPIVFTNDEDSTILVNRVNSSYGVSSPTTGRFNLSLAVFSADAGKVTIEDLNFRYNITDGSIFPISTSIDPNYIRYVTIAISNFTQRLPNHILNWEIRPRTITSKNVQPYGQTATTPIFNVTNNHLTRAVDVYIRLNQSMDSMGLSCSNIKLNGTYTYLNISATSQLYCNNIGVGQSCSLWAYEDFNCTSAQISKAVYNPVFVYDALCEECVVAAGAFD